MERDQRRHQQPVEGGHSVGVLLVLACLIVAIAATLWGLNAVRQQRSGAVADGSSGAVAPPNDKARDTADRDAAVTAQTFLRALDERADAAAGPSADNAVAARLTWAEERPMTEAAADLLRVYREVPTAQLALSGYLDIKGNVWGAIVRDGRGWVDMVTVAADAGDASCRLRAVRLVPQASGSKEGS